MLSLSPLFWAYIDKVDRCVYLCRRRKSSAGKEQALLAPAGISARCWDSVSAGRGNDFLSVENKETFNASRLLKIEATKLARVSVENINNFKYKIKCKIKSSNSRAKMSVLQLTNYRLKWIFFTPTLYKPNVKSKTREIASPAQW